MKYIPVPCGATIDLDDPGIGVGVGRGVAVGLGVKVGRGVEVGSKVGTIVGVGCIVAVGGGVKVGRATGDGSAEVEVGGWALIVASTIAMTVAWIFGVFSGVGKELLQAETKSPLTIQQNAKSFVIPAILPLPLAFG